MKEHEVKVSLTIIEGARIAHTLIGIIATYDNLINSTDELTKEYVKEYTDGVSGLRKIITSLGSIDDITNYLKGMM